jgi:hypothetical protein
MSRNPLSPSILFATLFLSSAFAAEATAQTASFIARRDFATGDGPLSVAVADFNEDGTLDLAVANSISDNVSVMLGNGDGTFQPAVDYVTGTSPYSVAVSDFNRDGAADLAVANNGGATDGNVSVLLGNGDGTFQTAIGVPAGRRPHSVAVGDFNRDGATDLAVADARSNTVLVLLGNGDGTFQPELTFGTGSGPFSIAVGDLNGDTVPDLAVANSVSYSVSVLLGNGDGSFGIAQNFHTGPHPFSVKVGDFNADGSADLVVVNLGDSVTKPLHGWVSVLLGNGTGTFEVGARYAAGTSPRAVAIADFNGDGHVDLVTGGLVLMGNGDGTFETVENRGTGNGHWSLATGDFNRDGSMDFVGPNSDADTVSVLLGKGDGTFLAAPAFPTDVLPSSVAVDDFNGDGVADLAVAHETANGTVSVLLGSGNGTFQAAQKFATGGSFGSRPRAVATGDFNGDGRPDLVVANRHFDGSLSVLLGNGDGTFQTAANYAVGSAPSSVGVGDFNNDGVLDLVVPHPGSSSVSLLMGRGDGTFQAGPTYPAAYDGYEDVVVANIDGDDNLDFAIPITNGVLVRFGNGDGTFQSKTVFDSGGFHPSTAVADLNGDGEVDLVLSGGGDGYGLTVRLNSGFEGGRTFHPPQYVYAGRCCIPSVTVGDFNGDGVPDLATAWAYYDDVSVLLGNGDGSFRAPLIFGAGSGLTSIAASDFNEDGKLDLVLTNQRSNGVSVLINNTPTYGLTVSREGNGSGTVTSTSSPVSATQIDCGTVCAATYNGGTQVTLTASADAGSTFAGWTGCDTVSDTTCTVTMSEAKSVAATFTLQQFALTVTKEGIGRGTVTSSSDPAGSTQIDCGTACSASFDWGTVVTLTATPGFANRFFGWSGCDAASGPTCTITIRADGAVTATFHGFPFDLPPRAQLPLIERTSALLLQSRAR